LLSDSSAANGPYRLFLFGTPRLVCDGQALAFTRRKAPLLLGYLAMHPGQHPRDSLAALLWPDRDPDAARLSLRVTVAELRKRLGDAAVTGDRQTLQLKADFALWVDALEIQRCAASAQPQDWQAALQWHDGEFAPGAAPAWADAWRARLGRWQVEILLKLCAHERTQADYPQAIALARRVSHHNVGISVR
jgi:DNA-binding SARP family transcriptional activator